MENYMVFTIGKLKACSDLHLIELLEEINSPKNPLTMLMVDDLLQRMVIGGSSPDCIIHGVPMALGLIQIAIRDEGARRWMEMRSKFRIEEKKPEFPYNTHEVNFPVDHFERKFRQVN